jgi:hypothetical protein
MQGLRKESRKEYIMTMIEDLGMNCWCDYERGLQCGSHTKSLPRLRSVLLRTSKLEKLPRVGVGVVRGSWCPGDTRLEHRVKYKVIQRTAKVQEDHPQSNKKLPWRGGYWLAYASTRSLIWTAKHAVTSV